MARSTRTAAGKRGRRKETRGRGSARNSIDAPEIGTRIDYRCPSCNSAANATYKLSRGGIPEWFIGCWTFACEGGSLAFLALELDLDPAADKDEIAAALAKANPPRKRDLRPSPLPGDDRFLGWHERLLEDSEARRYLADRGVCRTVIRANQLGWNGAFVVLPMRDRSGEIVAFKRRAPRFGAKTLSVGGSGRLWPLYPTVPAEGWVLLVAGEFDALAARSVGLPGVSVTLGAGHWRDEWTADLRRRQVVVCFDNNEEEQARVRVRELRRSGIDAQRLDLRTLGLNTPKGDLNDYLTNGGDPSAVRPRRIVRRRRSAA